MFTLSRSTTLLLLLTAAAVQQVRYVSRAVLPAQDVVDTVSVAQRIQREGLPATMRAEPVSPLFPALVAATHAVLSSCKVIDASDWIRPPQVVAAVALILAVIPIFLTTERLGGRGAGVIAAIFYISLPALARLGADGLGDAVHLCLVAWSAWFLGWARWGVAGVGIAAAMLVRAEAAIVPLAVLLLAVPLAKFRVPRFFLAAACSVLPFLAVGVTSPDEIIARLRGGGAPTEETPLNDFSFAERDNPIRPPQGRWATSTGDWPPQKFTFGHKDRALSSRFHGLGATCGEFVSELLAAGGYLLPLFVVLGIWHHRQAGGSNYDAFVAAAVGLQVIVLFGMAWKNGYLSTRHFALPVILTLPYAALGAVTACKHIAERTVRRTVRARVFAEMALVGGFAVVAIIASARPLHQANAAHRQAAEWLQTTGEPGCVLDQQGFTALKTGRTTYRYDAADQALGHPLLVHILVERADLERDSPRGRSLRVVLGEASGAAMTFAAPRGDTDRDVLIFSRPDKVAGKQGFKYAR